MINVSLSIYKYLPDVLIHKIIHYTDVIVYRHGKYMNKLNKNDERYRILQTIPKPIKVYKNNILHKIMLKLLNITKQGFPGYLIEYMFDTNMRMNVKYITRETDGFDRYISIKTFSVYIYNSDKWNKIF
jgi:hypothetical protein